ncbi:class I SAM-dependent methyltransferase [Kitasatospora sp. MAA19]|uniref:class I SAM-dependent methyltransferase n=1 Tax=Kitasatospora sp. MAA19 TaxID=3035090 RepID=UPI002472FC56|nr:class I SAM-dependent methyltransferase [Kitasatospora sp. MAA19]
MADESFTHPRLAALYDPLQADRGDLDAYLDLAGRLGARTVLDIGCGTGVFALLLAARGAEVVGVDPARACLDVARAKPGAEHVCWIHGDAVALPPPQVDLVAMTANTAQEITGPRAWHTTLARAFEALRPGGHLVFETRDPARRAWEGWNRDATRTVTDLPGAGAVETWADLVAVDGALVTFRWTYVFATDGQVLTSTSTLRFRERAEVEADLAAHGFALHDVRGAPDRPGRELVFIATRPPRPSPDARPAAGTARPQGT